MVKSEADINAARQLWASDDPAAWRAHASAYSVAREAGEARRRNEASVAAARAACRARGRFSATWDDMWALVAWVLERNEWTPSGDYFKAYDADDAACVEPSTAAAYEALEAAANGVAALPPVAGPVADKMAAGKALGQAVRIMADSGKRFKATKLMGVGPGFASAFLSLMAPEFDLPFYGEEAIHGMAHPKVVGKYRCPTYEVYAAEIHEKAAQLGMRRQEVEQALWVAARTGYLVRKDAPEHALQAPIQPSAAIAAAKAGGTGAGLKRSAADDGASGTQIATPNAKKPRATADAARLGALRAMAATIEVSVGKHYGEKQLVYYEEGEATVDDFSAAAEQTAKLIDDGATFDPTDAEGLAELVTAPPEDARAGHYGVAFTAHGLAALIKVLEAAKRSAGARVRLARFSKAARICANMVHGMSARGSIHTRVCWTFTDDAGGAQAGAAGMS
uniref:Uncharacterized protein n=1 Tax=Prasinoderma singulare TaxID=676789 RepID=A0A7S3BPG0_9VIRI